MWMCVNCRESNADESDACEVCDRPRPAYVAPAGRSHPSPAVPPRPAPDPDAYVEAVAAPYPYPYPYPSPAHAAPPEYPQPQPRRRGRPVLVAALVVAGLVAGAAIAVPLLLRDDDPAVVYAPPAEPASTDTAVPDPTDTGEAEPTDTDEAEPTDTAEPTETVPATVGIVRIGADLADSRAADVAAMFDTYFTGINDKDYDAVGTVLDPAGTIDPNDPEDMRSLARGTRTTRDSDVELTALTDPGDGGLLATVAFRSHQASGDGPKGRTSETCTRWDITYTLSFADRYRVVRAKASSQAC